MKTRYITPTIKVIYDVCEPMLYSNSEDIQSKDNNDLNGGGTLNAPGINYGNDWTGGDASEGDLPD